MKILCILHRFFVPKTLHSYDGPLYKSIHISIANFSKSFNRIHIITILYLFLVMANKAGGELITWYKSINQFIIEPNISPKMSHSEYTVNSNSSLP